MKEDNLLCVKKQFKPLTANSNHPHKVYPNLLRYKKLTRHNQGWASDITYIQLRDSFVYLAVFLDVFTRKCIGWQLGKYLDTQLTLDALNQALRQRWNLSLESKKAFLFPLNRDICVCMPEPFTPNIGLGIKVA